MGRQAEPVQGRSRVCRSPPISEEGPTASGLGALARASCWGAVRQTRQLGAPVTLPNEGFISRSPTSKGKKRALNASATLFELLGGTLLQPPCHSQLPYLAFSSPGAKDTPAPNPILEGQLDAPSSPLTSTVKVNPLTSATRQEPTEVIPDSSQWAHVPTPALLTDDEALDVTIREPDQQLEPLYSSLG